MKKLYKLSSIFFAVLFLSSAQLSAQNAKVQIDKNKTYQKVTGFGGFVCSPQFGYNYMSVDEIKKMWGTNSEAGYNIMRLYIPGESNWATTLATAKLAKNDLGLKIFASPWTMPAEWKTNNSEVAVYTDENGVKQVGYLKEEHYEDYALYLNRYVTYLSDNGVELDYISIQNEPDEMATYQGCIWTPVQIAAFVKNYGHLINCKVIAPESVGYSDAFSNAFLDADVMNNFEVYGVHQYGGIQSKYKQFQNYNKEIWMTEYLINWNSGGTVRDFNWGIDAFSFANSVNDALLGNVNAWIHYSAKRYYALMGDGTNGTVSGEITKRGHILSQYAKFTTGTTRVESTWSDATAQLKGSSYINDAGDKIVLTIINPSQNTYNLTVDLPFYSVKGTKIITSQSVDIQNTAISFAETFRPVISIDPSSFITLIFEKSKERVPSQMTSKEVHYAKIENQSVTNAAFGTTYQMSGKTVTFANANPLISTNMDGSNGYLKLDNRYNKFILHVKSFTTANQANTDNTTLYYINDNGEVKSKNYGKFNFPTGVEFDLTFDISKSVLTDGCTGIIGLRNSNYSSVLTLNLGDVYFNIADEKAAEFAGIYSDDDSLLMDALQSTNYVSLDFRNATGISSSQDWHAKSVNKNSIFYVADNNTANNVISGTTCNNLKLMDQGGDFNVPFGFSALAASFTKTISGNDVLVLPYEANIPQGVISYTLEPSSAKIICNKIEGVIPANTPVLLSGSGTFVFSGTGNVSTPKNLTVDQMNPVYIGVKAPAGSYTLKTVNNVTAFYPVTAGSEPLISSFNFYLSEKIGYNATLLPLEFATLGTVQNELNEVSFKLYPNPALEEIFVDKMASDFDYKIFNVQGILVNSGTLKNGNTRIKIESLPAGVYFINGTNDKSKISRKFVKK
ncbi:T9SS type A sorting domain-containing protein [Flavobacterium pectinovorum]|uniref:T9SS type A sorting domain-containing protein n=1 Tax=Flavobacterium pectinovorum TaxID=29533 RepID=UPI00265DE338|nr:T9SS type A sorting domain-containing protein [Flavobacterium pectinovorum]WKL49755.1 T9SS type A sorting domain-containing protein [Flavobacterium pectinovorum]